MPELTPAPPSVAGSGVLLPALLSLAYFIIAAPVWIAVGAELHEILIGSLLAATLIALSVIDLRTMRLPDHFTLPLLALGLAVAVSGGFTTFLYHAASAVLAGFLLYAVLTLYRHVRGRDGLGLGDVKLFAAAGAWTGPDGIGSTLLIGCLTALAAAAVWRLRSPDVTGLSALPFGPSLALGLWIVWLYGPLT